MPEIGEIRKPSEVGHKGHSKLMWCACADCGKTRWVNLTRGEPDTSRCATCSADYARKLLKIRPASVIPDCVKKDSHWYKSVTCPKCNSNRFVRVRISDVHPRSEPTCPRCLHRDLGYRIARAKDNLGDKAHNWNGGRMLSKSGYVWILLYANDPFFPMLNRRGILPSGTLRTTGYVLEHRLVMARHLGRCLTSQEKVHHINEVRDDNRIENLQLFSNNGEHISKKHPNIGYHGHYINGYHNGWADALRHMESEPVENTD